MLGLTEAVKVQETFLGWEAKVRVEKVGLGKVAIDWLTIYMSFFP